MSIVCRVYGHDFKGDRSVDSQVFMASLPDVQFKCTRCPATMIKTITKDEAGDSLLGFVISVKEKTKEVMT